MKIFLVCGVASDAERNQAMLLFRELSARGNDVTLLGKWGCFQCCNLHLKVSWVFS